MSVSPAIVPLCDDRSYDDSTGPTTPGSSPLFRPWSPSEEKIRPPVPLFPNGHKLLQFEYDQVSPERSVAGSVSTPPIEIKRICVIGAGYVGGPTAAVIAFHNPSIRVEVLDRDENRIARWKGPHLPIHEPELDKVVRITRDGALGLGEDMQAQVGSDPEESETKRLPNLFFTTESQRCISEADTILLAVNTPTKTFGIGGGRATNMAAVDGAVRDIALYARPGTIIVEKSTVPSGTAKRIRRMIDSLRHGLSPEVLSNPEFLAEGSAIKNLMNPDRVIIGSSDTSTGRAAAAALANVYAAWVPRSSILEIGVWSSELCKLVANAMLAQRISSINSISAICEKTGADIDEVAKAVGLDVRIGPQYLKASLGFGGSCFRKDICSLQYLAESLGLDDVAEYWSQVNSMNNAQWNRFARKVIECLGGHLRGSKVAILGFAFKKNTGDTRESLATNFINMLLQERPAEIMIYDPFCREEDILTEIDAGCSFPDQTRQRTTLKVEDDPYTACRNADAVIIVTEHDQFRNKEPVQTPRAMTTSKFDLVCEKTGKPFESTDLEATTILDGRRMEEETYRSYRLTPQPRCESNCSECAHDLGANGVPKSQQPLEWARITSGLKEPKSIFDGKGIIDVQKMEKLGVRVGTIGRQQSDDGF